MSIYGVFKFGGSSLKDAAAISQVTSIINKEETPVIVIVSAMGGITDLLITTAKKAASGDLSAVDDAAKAFRDRHIDAMWELLKDNDESRDLYATIEKATTEFRSICESVGILREITDRTIAKTVARGERTMAKLVSLALKHQGTKAVYLDATDVIKVTPSPVGVLPITEKCDQAANTQIKPLVEQGNVVVIPGFLAEGPDKELVTLGRGGSDYSAAIIASSLKASWLRLYKEVDGILTADPRYVADARIVRELHYREAAELAYYGAKVLHPCTIIPLTERQVPLVIKNTFAPEKEGTRISGEVNSEGASVKALTAIPDQAVVAVEGKGMMGVPGIAGRTFSALARGDISVTMISQASSESSICFVVPGHQAQLVKDMLTHEFRFELTHHMIDGVKIKAQKTIVALVGLGMSGKRGTAARSFNVLAKEGINIDAIAQGSSELNISLVIDGHQIKRALKALHREFRLEKSHALPELMGQKVSLAIFGFGQIGTTLAEQISTQKDYFEQTIKSECQIISLTDSAGSLTEKEGFSPADIKNLIEAKRGGTKIGKNNNSDLPQVAEDLRSQLWSLPFAKGIFVDTTAEETAPILKEALSAGMNIVLANKKPLAVKFEDYQEMLDIAKQRGLHFRYEATVGAGLPVLDTLAKLESAGDEVISVLGCFSGTLGYLMTQMEDGAQFSEAVDTAFRKGYTEPDPREDLSGMDVARKALILARTLGKKVEIRDIELEPLFPERLSHDDPSTFIANLKQLDEEYMERIARANREGKVLRYVARMCQNDVSVKIEAISKDSPLGRLRGTDNQITVRTRRYDSNPLIVTGPGAGADVTAAGVLNDIMAIAAAQGGE